MAETTKQQKGVNIPQNLTTPVTTIEEAVQRIQALTRHFSIETLSWINFAIAYTLLAGPSGSVNGNLMGYSCSIWFTDGHVPLATGNGLSGEMAITRAFEDLNVTLPQYVNVNLNAAAAGAGAETAKNRRVA